jgi:DNA-binding XRE family transcriptional regulator
VAVANADADRDEIVRQGKAVLAARRIAREMLGQLKQERERRGLSLADMMRLTGMSRESISRLENDPKPNPTVLTFARYAAALGLELQFSTRQ